MLYNIKVIFKKLIIPIRKWQKSRKNYAVIYNVNGSGGKSQKRALLIYLTAPFELKNSDRHFLYHQNFRQCKQIAELLGKMGYIVDVADIADQSILSTEEYDFVISHNIENELTSIKYHAGAKRVYLGTGLNHTVHNNNLQKRLDNFVRNKKKIPEIEWHTESMAFLKHVDAIIAFGNDFTANAWKESSSVPVYTFNNYGFFPTEKRNDEYTAVSKNFLFFSSRQQLLKGLDLLLDVFSKHPQLHLYVCGPFRDEKIFCDCYKKELFHLPNIHPIGWVDLFSWRYYDVIKKCAYVVLPSCSEASTGSVVQCMCDGLIPVVTHECGIDTEDFGITFENDDIRTINETISKLSMMSNDWCISHSNRTKEVCRDKYTSKRFEERWYEILTDLKI